MNGRVHSLVVVEDLRDLLPALERLLELRRRASMLQSKGEADGRD